MIFKELFSQNDHVLWLFIQQLFVRGLIAIKFLLAARFLGPEIIGLIGIAMLSLSIIESLSDTGLAQAVVQTNKKIDDHQAGAVWTLQLFRGFMLSGLLSAFAVPISLIFNVPESSNLIVLAAFIPLLRNALNPGIFLLQRERNFKQIFIYEVVAALIDLSSTILLIQFEFGAASILLGNIAGDISKVMMTWAIYRIALAPNICWREIQYLTSFGKWVWGSSVITLILNQTDKILIAKFLGPTEFGLYQVATRIAQLVVAEPGGVLGQYLYPTFSRYRRISSLVALKYLFLIFRRWTPGLLGLTLLLIIFSNSLLVNIIGQEWAAAVPLLRIMAAPMFMGAIIAILVAYFRGIGAPRIVTQATIIQLMVLIACAPVFLYFFGSRGMAFSLAVAGSAAIGYMFHNVRSKESLYHSAQ